MTALRALRLAATDLRLALRDLGHQRAFSAFFVANLALGLTGALLLDSLQASVFRTIQSRSRAMLGADLRISSTRELTAGEIARFDAAASGGRTSDVVEMYSMVSGKGRSRLVELRGIDGAFPLHGSIVLDGGGPPSAGDRRRLDDEREAWADPALLEQLGVAVGDRVRIGSGDFRIAATLARDTGLSLRAVSLAPRLYLSRARLLETGLVQTGSRVEWQRLVALPAGEATAAAAERVRAAIDDARVRVTSHSEAVAEITGAYSRVTRYLGLVSLVALAMAGIASAHLFHAFLRRRLADLAILQSLGASAWRAQRIVLLEVTLLAAASAPGAVALVMLLLPVVARLVAGLLPPELTLGVGAAEAATTLGVALVAGPLSCLPMLMRLRTLRIAELFQERADFDLARRRTDLLWAVPGAAALAVVAVRRVGDAAQGLWFAGGVAVAILVAFALARIVLPFLASRGERARVAVRLALRQLSPRRSGSRTAFTALALTALLLFLPPQLRALMLQQLEPAAGDSVPSLFLFDIQPEQSGPLADLLRESGTSFQRLAPMVRARLVTIGGAAVDAPKAGAPLPQGARDSDRLAARAYNLTWQRDLHSTERLVAGRPFGSEWTPDSGAPAEISMEVEFARRLGVGLGDRLAFDVQGVPVEGVVVNLREVRWTSLQPNFFVSFQPGVLDGAPAVYLGSVPALPPDGRDALQAKIVERFPNVSMIDVTRGVERATTLLTQLRWAVLATAWTAFAVGLVLVFAIARDEAEERRRDFLLMKVLGASHELLRGSVTIEFAVLAAAATATGIAAALAISAVLASFVLEVSWSPAWQSLAVVAAALPLVTTVTARLAMRRVLAERPQLALG